MSSIPEIRKFEELLMKNHSFESNWKYISHSTRYLIPPGENYGSVILAVDVLYEENNKRNILYMVAKLCPPNDILKAAFLCDLTFKKEIQAYVYSNAAIIHFQEDHNIPEEKRIDFFPKCYGARYNLTGKDEIDMDATILLENLKILGYFVEDRMKGFDLLSAELVLKNLARLQATVIAMRLLNPKEYNTNILPALNTVNNGGPMVDGFIGAAIKLLKTIQECEPYWKQIKDMTDARKQYNGLIFPVKTNQNFYSMIHTDFWINNVMICKNENGYPIKAKMLDLQFLDFGSVVRDILLFLFTSVENNILHHHFDDLFKYYHDQFYDCLIQFNCPEINLEKYSWPLFLEEVNDVAPHQLFHILFMLKPIFSERGSIENLENIDVKVFERTDNLGEIYLTKLKNVVLTYASKKWLL